MGCGASRDAAAGFGDAAYNFSGASSHGPSAPRDTYSLTNSTFHGLQMVNQYLVIRQIGQGAHGAVNAVIDMTSGRLYAMKLINKRKQRRRSALGAMGRRRSNAAYGPGGGLSGQLSAGLSDGSRTNSFGARVDALGTAGSSELPAVRAGGPPGSRLGKASGPGDLLPPISLNVTASGGSMIDVLNMAADAELLHEIEVMRALAGQPNCVALHEVVQDPGAEQLVIVQEFMDGGPLQARAGGGRDVFVALPEAALRPVFADMLAGLSHMHACGIAHGDLKPENAMLTSAGRVKLVDFGSAKFVQLGELMANSPGTPAFMAPEICAGTPYDAIPADAWALGVSLFMLAAGVVPWRGGNLLALYDRIRSEPHLLPAGVQASAPLVDLIDGLLRKDPAARLTLAQVRAHPWLSGGGAPDSRAALCASAEALRLLPDDWSARHRQMWGALEVLRPDSVQSVALRDGEQLVGAGEELPGLLLVAAGALRIEYTESLPGQLDAELDGMLSGFEKSVKHLAGEPGGGQDAVALQRLQLARYAVAAGGAQRLCQRPPAGPYVLQRHKGCMVGRPEPPSNNAYDGSDTPLRLTARGATSLLLLRADAAEETLRTGLPAARAILARLAIECEVQELLDTVAALTAA